MASIDVTAASATGTLAVDLVDTGGIGGNAPVFLVTRDQATGQVIESRLLFPARATFASTTPLGTPLVVASTTVGVTTPIANGTLFYHQDGLGSVTDLTNSVGATVKSYSYDAYGTIVDQTGTLDQPYSYTGRELDTETGLYYHRARYYDSISGRFLQQDPGSAGINSARLPRHPLDLFALYVYAADNPIRLIDPWGKKPQEPSGVGVEACKYYDDVGRANNCNYHPYAKDYCEHPEGNPCIRKYASAGVIAVIRQELIIEDQKARIDRNTEACLNPGCATGEAVVAYHKKVFAAHGIPEWCFPFFWLSVMGAGDR